jgi:DNA-binding response OmpR family regulator
MKQRDRILVVDDDGDARELFAAALKQAGYAVDLASDGTEALAQAKAVRPDLVLTDLQMPGINGIDLIRYLHAIDETLPVVLTTGRETRDLCTAADSYGAVACLPKPVNLDELLWAIERALACRPPAVAPQSNAAAFA